MSTRKYVTKAGYKTRLDCPACGKPVKSMKPWPRDSEYPGPHWMEGDRGMCECGADLVVEADGKRAWLKVVEEPNV